MRSRMQPYHLSSAGRIGIRQAMAPAHSRAKEWRDGRRPEATHQRPAVALLIQGGARRDLIADVTQLV